MWWNMLKGITNILWAFFAQIFLVWYSFAQQQNWSEWWWIVSDTTNAGTESWLAGLLKFGDLWIFFIRLVVAIIVVILLWVLSKLFSGFVRKRIRANSIWDDEYTRKVSGLIWEVIFYTLIIFSVLIGFMIIQVDFWWILWWISFGIWFAFKDILWNLLAGILVLTNKEYRLWDIIEVDFEGEKTYFWRIEEITIRYTVIRTFDLRKVIVPNLSMVMNPVRTYDGEELVRLETSVTIHYETKVDWWLEKIKSAVNSLKFIKEKDSTKVILKAMGDHGLEIRVFFYIDPTEWKLIPVAQWEVNDAIYDMFTKEGIVIPYPHSTITVDHNDKNLLWSALWINKHKDG